MSQLASAADATPTSRTRSVSKRAVLGVACAALVLFVALAALMALVADLGAPADPTRGELEKHRRHRTSHTPRHSSVFPEVPPPDPWLIWKSNNQTVWKPPTTCKPCMENRCHPHLEDKCSAQRGFLDPWFLELDQCMCSCCNTQCKMPNGYKACDGRAWLREIMEELTIEETALAKYAPDFYDLQQRLMAKRDWVEAHVITNASQLTP